MSTNPTTAPVGRGRPRLGAVIEALAVACACLATVLFVALALFLVVAPERTTASFDLRAATAGAIAPDDVAARVRSLGLTDDVAIEGTAAAPRLVLRDLPSDAEVESRVHEALRGAGYRPEPMRGSRLPALEPEIILASHPRLFLGAQSIVLLAFGLTFGALRVTPKPRAAPSRAVLVGVGVGLLGLVASLAIGGVQRLVGLEVEEQAWVVDLLSDPAARLAMAPWLVLVAPFAEEAFFRGYLFRFLDERAGARIAYVLSAACFAAIHLHPSGTAVYFVVGLLFAWACRRTGTLTAAVAAHAVYNGSALGLAILGLGG